MSFFELFHMIFGSREPVVVLDASVEKAVACAVKASDEARRAIREKKLLSDAINDGT